MHTMEYILRDHNTEKFEVKKSMIKLVEKFINEKYGEGTVKVTIRDQYKNMIENIKPCMHLIDNATDAMKDFKCYTSYRTNSWWYRWSNVKLYGITLS